MKAPLEDLIIRLWDTIEKLGIGILAPLQMKRLSKAQIEVEFNEAISKQGLTKLLAKANAADEKNYIEVLNNSALIRKDREFKNTVNAIKYAYISLEDNHENDQESAQGDINEDWIYRWREYAEKVSAEDLQILWGKILAGEVRKPGSISYRLMDFIDKLTATDIEDITKIFSLVEKKNFLIIRGAGKDISYLSNDELNKGFFSRYSELGIVSPSTAGVVNVTTNLDFTSYLSFDFEYSNCTLTLKNSDPEKPKKSILYYQLGIIGKELFSMSQVETNEDYLSNLKTALEEDGFNVSIA